MAKRLTHPAAFDDLPHPIRSEALDQLLADVSTRKVSATIAKHGYQVSHATLARYRRDRIKPAIANSEKVLAIQQLANSDFLGSESVTDVTKLQLDADPLISRIQKKYERYDKLTNEAVQAKDYTGFAAIDRSETQAIRLHAELTGRLVDKGPTMNVQMVFAGNTVETTPKQEPLDNGDVIDIRAVTR